MKPLKRSLLALTLGVLSLSALPEASRAATAADMTISQSDFRASMRRLWDDHVAWTRLFIVSDVNNLGDKAATTQRLLRNQQDIGSAIATFYGHAAGAKLAQLLTDHILIAAKVVDAAKARDNRQLNLVTQQWFANADQIALFLSTANPRNWSLSAVKDMMHRHLQLTTAEATDYLNGSYAASASDYDRVHDEIDMMSDALSSGIIAQFPRMFR